MTPFASGLARGAEATPDPVVIVIPREGNAKTQRYAYRQGRVVASYGTVLRVRLVSDEPDIFFQRADLAAVHVGGQRGRLLRVYGRLLEGR